MCGRYASSRNPGDLMLEFEVEENDLDENLASSSARYNIAPTDTVPVVLERLIEPEAGGLVTGETSGTPADSDSKRLTVRRLSPLAWGLVPSWSKDRTGGARMINARVESLLEKPAYRKAALARRCLVPADGWYEWQPGVREPDVKGKPRKQPYFLQLANGTGLAFAGIYEFWRDRTLESGDPRAWLVTFAVITTPAEPGLARIHDRMPLVLPAERWSDWLDPRLREQADVRVLLEPPPPGRFAVVPVTTRVNSVRNDGPELLQPAPLDQVIGGGQDEPRNESLF